MSSLEKLIQLKPHIGVNLYRNLSNSIDKQWTIDKIDYLYEKHSADIDPIDTSEKSLVGLIKKIEQRNPSTEAELANIGLEDSADIGETDEHDAGADNGVEESSAEEVAAPEEISATDTAPVDTDLLKKKA